MRTLGVFTTSRNETYHRSAQVLARTDRGLEVGEVLCEATEAAVAKLHEPGKGQLQRELTPDDERELHRLRALTLKEFQKCQELIAQLHLQMELVDVEHLFGGERIVFYYLAEQRVDFRELVKMLATEFQTRIELRQIGVRDEARLIADYGDCGKPVCCNTHLSEMPPVSMKMAKLQRATLDPSKISGRCGRLKCCLRYEYDTYVAMQAELPPLSSHVLTRNGRGRVLGQEILTQQLLIETEDHRRVLIPASDVLTVLPNPGTPGRGASAKRKKTGPGEGASPEAVPERPAGESPAVEPTSSVPPVESTKPDSATKESATKESASSAAAAEQPDARGAGSGPRSPNPPRSTNEPGSGRERRGGQGGGQSGGQDRRQHDRSRPPRGPKTPPESAGPSPHVEPT